MATSEQSSISVPYLARRLARDKEIVPSPSPLGGLALRVRVGVGIPDVERRAVARGLHDAHVLGFQVPRMAAGAGVGDHVDFLVHAGRVVGDTQIFLFDHEPALQAGVVRRHARGTGILVAAERLDAPERENEAARSGDGNGADAQPPPGPGRWYEAARGHVAGAA